MKGSVFTSFEGSALQAEEYARQIMERYPSLQVSVKKKIAGGDDVSMMILGLHNAIRTGRLHVSGDRQIALKKVSATSCVFGFVAADEALPADTLFEIHKDLGGALIIEGDLEVYVI